ncbi:MFS transporter [Phyllobacterium myrsinacearum]|uniref:EmrB/QacA subfamily drug resistance transporter n=1 Tax=Phyllobacterium myrsinacearum TaxID=28101 RepID=A0A839ERT7_9HYPH|nr:MFS transporter [Phyllobacterium myrsinacearum]MBA8880918.1 EmrB/QacA subfamily drug resistance transporter [Phyllobacterium myrsinacearum]
MSARARIATLYLLGFAIDLANMFIFNAALPALGRELAASVAELAWVGTIYMLGLTVAIPLGSWLARRIGERRVLVASLLIVAVGSIGGGKASGIATLLAWRLVQGLGGGLLVPVGQSMAYRAYPPEDRAHLTAVVMTVALLVPALSPAIGGVAADHVSWRWVFIGIAPLAAAIAVLALVWAPVDRLTGAKPALDIQGFLLSAITLFCLPLGLTLISQTGSGPQAMILLVIAAVAGVAYVRHALRSREPLLDLRLLSDPMLRTGSIIYLCVPGVFTGVNLIASLYFQDRLGLTATQTGMMMLPWAGAAFVAIMSTRKLFASRGPRPLFLVGMALTSVGVLLLATPFAGQFLVRIASFIAMGFGASLCTSTAQTAAFTSIRTERTAEASALWNINRQLSFSLGGSVLGGLLGLFLVTNGGAGTAMPYRTCFVIASILIVLPLPFVLRLQPLEPSV